MFLNRISEKTGHLLYKLHLNFINSFKSLLHPPPLPPHDKFYASSLFSSRRRNVFAVSDRYLYWSLKIANVFTKAEYKTVTRIK